jgi:hypothetical protein
MSRFKFDQSVPDADISKVFPVNGTQIQTPRSTLPSLYARLAWKGGVPSPGIFTLWHLSNDAH